MESEISFFQFKDIKEIGVTIWKEVRAISDTRYTVKFFLAPTGEPVAENAYGYSSVEAATIAAHKQYK